MGISKAVDRIRAWLVHALPIVTRWLWLAAAIVFTFVRIKLSEPEGILNERIPSVFACEEFTPWIVLAFVFSTLYAIASWRKWKSTSWFSMASWLFALGGFLIWFDNEVWLPDVLDLVSVETIIDFDGWSYVKVPIQVLDLHLMIVMTVLLAVLSLHASDKQEGGSAIGGRWKQVWAWLLGMIVSALFEQFNPIAYGLVYFSEGEWSYFDLLYGGEEEPNIFGHATLWLVIVSPLVSGFLVAAWKSRARIAFSDERMSVSFGKGLPLFSVAWKRILSVTELVLPGRWRSVVVEHGVLPWYRLRFGLHGIRDGADVVDEVLRRTQGKRQEVRVRRGTTWAGVAMIVGAVVCIKVMEHLVITGSEAMTASSGDFVEVFESSGYFIELASLQMGSSVLFGGGVALALASNYGGVRTLPLLGVALGAVMMPDILIYGLVYIAIYAILAARLGPVESLPNVNFPDESLMTFSFWTASYKMQIAVCAYLVFAMIAVRPWYRALPWWPYKKQVGSSAEDATNGT